MGKNKIPIQRKEHKTERQTTYCKRSRGLLKKAYELSVLCGVDVALIMFSPSDVLRQFSTNPRLEKVLQSFVQSLPNLPEEEREKLQISQDIINRINISAGLDDVVNQQSLGAVESEEMDKEIGDCQNKLMMLQQLDKMLNPCMEAFRSVQEFGEHRRYLLEALNSIRNKKNEMLSRLLWPPCTNSTQLKVQKPMQQLPQAESEAGKWGPQYGGEQLQQGVPLGTVDASPHFTGEEEVSLLLEPLQDYGVDASPRMSVSHVISGPNLHVQNPMEQELQAGTEAGMWGPVHEGEQLQQGDPSSVLQPGANASPCLPVPDFTGEHEISVPTAPQCEILNPLQGGDVEHEQQDGMTPSGSGQPIINLSSSIWMDQYEHPDYMTAAPEVPTPFRRWDLTNIWGLF